MLNTVVAFKDDDEIAGEVPSVFVWKLKFFTEDVDESLDVEVDFPIVKLEVEVSVGKITGLGFVVLTIESLLDVALFDAEVTVLDPTVVFLTPEGVVEVLYVEAST